MSPCNGVLLWQFLAVWNNSIGHWERVYDLTVSLLVKLSWFHRWISNSSWSICLIHILDTYCSRQHVSLGALNIHAHHRQMCVPMAFHNMSQLLDLRRLALLTLVLLRVVLVTILRTVVVWFPVKMEKERARSTLLRTVLVNSNRATRNHYISNSTWILN